MFVLQTKHGVCVVDFNPMMSIMAPTRLNGTTMTAVQATGPIIDAQKGLLHHFHLRLGQISYDTVERPTKYPDYGIELAGHVREN